MCAIKDNYNSNESEIDTFILHKELGHLAEANRISISF